MNVDLRSFLTQRGIKLEDSIIDSMNTNMQLFNNSAFEGVKSKDITNTHNIISNNDLRMHIANPDSSYFSKDTHEVTISPFGGSPYKTKAPSSIEIAKRKINDYDTFFEGLPNELKNKINNFEKIFTHVDIDESAKWDKTSRTVVNTTNLNIRVSNLEDNLVYGKKFRNSRDDSDVFGYPTDSHPRKYDRYAERQAWGDILNNDGSSTGYQILGALRY